jgi:hypothetical protein
MRKLRKPYDFNDYVIKLDKLGKIIIYLRKSREDMIDGRYASDEETLSRHEEQLQQWAEDKLGYRIPEDCIYKEVGSGEKIKTRPVFQEVLRQIEGEDVDAVLVVNCSRLSRGDLLDCGTIIKTFEVTNTLILTPSKYYDLNNKYDKRFFKDELLRGNDYLEQAKELLANGRHWSVSQGKFVGSVAPFGYDKVTCKEMNVADGKGFTLRANSNAEYVKLIFDMFCDGAGFHKIASHLKEINAPLLKNKEWDHCKVRNVLSSITYSGYLTWGERTKKERMIGGEIIEYRAKNDDFPIYKGLHTAIISESQYKAAQERAKIYGENPTRKDKDTKNPLAGILKCGICGRAMLRNPHSNQVTRKRKYPLDKAELQQFMNQHKKALKLSNAEIARRLSIKKHHANEWFSNNPKKFYPAEKFIEKWYEIKELLKITDDRFDKAVTVFEDVKKPETLSCSGHRCENVSSNLHIVEEMLLKHIWEKVNGYRNFLDNYAEEIIKKADVVKKASANIDKKISMLELQLKNAKIAYEQGADSLQEYIDRKKELNADLDALLEQKANTTIEVEKEKTITIKKSVPKLEKVIADYPELSAPERNALLKNIMESVAYFKEEKNSDNITLDICWLI